MVMVQQAPYSAAIIAALELKFPDDEDKKNKFIPCGSSLSEPNMTWDLDAFFSAFRDQISNADNLEKMLGRNWIKRSRLSGYKYFGEAAFDKVFENIGKNKRQLLANLDQVLEKENKKAAEQEQGEGGQGPQHVRAWHVITHLSI